jgi:O-antigen/teichoic acid export membrane protein
MDAAFLNTAWTLQIIRGFLLFAIVSSLAYPLSLYYGEPSLTFLIPAVGFIEAILGFRSIEFYIREKELRHFGPTLLNLGSSLLGLVSAIALALLTQSVWALVGSGIIAAIANVTGSFLCLPGRKHRLQWEGTAGKELVHFGKWITLSTAIAFLGTQGDRMILGKWMTMEELGIYTVAFFFAQSVTSLLSGTANRVLLPLLSTTDLDSHDSKRKAYNRSRASFLALAAPILVLFATAGTPFIDFLYDPRYAKAGPMLEILALGAMAAVLRSFFQPLMLSQGDSFRRMILSTGETTFLLAGMIAGGATFGLPGFLWGWVAAQAVSYGMGLFLVAKYELHALLPDLLLIAIVLSSTLLFLNS